MKGLISNDFNINLKNLTKEQHIKCYENEKVIKSKNQQSRKQIFNQEKSTRAKRQFFKNMNKIDKCLARLTGEREIISIILKKKKPQPSRIGTGKFFQHLYIYF